jgi:hypothetical protein
MNVYCDRKRKTKSKFQTLCPGAACMGTSISKIKILREDVSGIWIRPMIGVNGGKGIMFTNVEPILWQKHFYLPPTCLSCQRSCMPWTDVMNVRRRSQLIEKRTEGGEEKKGEQNNKNEAKLLL